VFFAESQIPGRGDVSYARCRNPGLVLETLGHRIVACLQLLRVDLRLCALDVIGLGAKPYVLSRRAGCGLCLLDACLGNVLPIPQSGRGHIRIHGAHNRARYPAGYRALARASQMVLQSGQCAAQYRPTRVC
jgi:hypothetical protein